jgi:hypothetical protein
VHFAKFMFITAFILCKSPTDPITYFLKMYVILSLCLSSFIRPSDARVASIPIMSIFVSIEMHRDGKL